MFKIKIIFVVSFEDAREAAQKAIALQKRHLGKLEHGQDF